MKTLQVVVGETLGTLQHARLDNITLVPASLLPLKGTYQPLANNLPTGSVLCVPGTLRQQKIIERVVSFFTAKGHFVSILPREKITRALNQPLRHQVESVPLAF